MKPFIPKKAVFFTVEEFMETIQFASAAADGEIPDAIPNPGGRGVTILGDDGEPQHLQLTDHSFNRFCYAVLTKFKADGVKYHSFLERFHAVNALRQSGAFDEFHQPHAGGDLQPGVATAIFRAAATLPLSIPGSFAPEPFLARVRELLAD